MSTRTMHTGDYWIAGEGAELLAQVRAGQLSRIEAAAKAGVSSSRIGQILVAQGGTKPKPSTEPSPPVSTRHIPGERPLRGTAHPEGSPDRGRKGHRDKAPSLSGPVGVEGIDVKIVVKLNGKEVTMSQFISFVNRLTAVRDTLQHLGID